MAKLYLSIFFSFLCIYVFELIKCEDMPNYFLTAAKSIPRIGRSNKGNSEFEKFFLKASKSVPRIGRRNENPYLDAKGGDSNEGNKFRYPTWSEIAERYEFEPELFTPQALSKYEEMMGDDPNVYDWDKVRLKRKTPMKMSSNK